MKSVKVIRLTESPISIDQVISYTEIPPPIPRAVLPAHWGWHTVKGHVGKRGKVIGVRPNPNYMSRSNDVTIY